MSDPNGTCMLMPSGVNADGAHRISWVIDKEGELPPHVIAGP